MRLHIGPSPATPATINRDEPPRQSLGDRRGAGAGRPLLRRVAGGRLAFCLLGVASPSDLTGDPRTTPFNVGLRIELADFTEAEAAPLAISLMVRELGRAGRREYEARALLERVLH